jgi:hypothetical protein
MNSPRVEHLTADQLDAILDEQTTAQVASHLATCADCSLMVTRDARLVRALSALPYFDAAPGFGDRVIGGLTPRAVALPAPVNVVTPRAVAARRRAIGAVVLASGGIAAGFIWAAAHPSDALSWSAPALRDAGHSLWVSLQSVVASATSQPWFASVRDALGTPTRALVTLAGTAGAYTVALVGLRRLMTEPAPDARW